MNAVNVMAIFLIVMLLAGCYEVKQDEKGRTVKINKITGYISVIDGDKIIKLKGEKEIKAEQEAAKKLSEAKQWPNLPLAAVDGANARLVTKYNDGVMYYQFFVDKNLRGEGNYFASLHIQLQDDASFILHEILVQLSAMTGNVGVDGKSVEAMEYKGQVSMSEDTYKKISAWNVTWAGFNK
jgi:hypothetical protein